MNKLKVLFSKKQWMISLLVVLSIVLIFIWSRMNFAGKHRIINQIEAEIVNDHKPFQFSSQQIIIERLINRIGNPIGKPASEISLTQIEEHLNSFPEIKKSTIYISFDGTLHLKIQERKAIALLINSEGRMCYLDTSLIMIAPPAKGGAPVLVINGMIHQKIIPGKKIHRKYASELKPLIHYFQKHSHWYQHFEQCYVDKFGQLLLFPNIGTHSVVLNNVENLHHKFENLRLFYKKGLQNLGWDTYKTIDISYKNQIVTRRHVLNNEHTSNHSVQD
jgi:hypothetical protein